jgi:hypothetical protein
VRYVLREWYEFQTTFNLRIRKGEDINGFLMGHATRKIGRGDVVDLRKDYSWLHSKRLGKISDYFFAEVPNAEELISHHTRFNVYSPFIDDEMAGSLYDWYLHGGDRPAITGCFKNRRVKGRLKFCEECVCDDLNSHGYSIWRRMHLMPGIDVCVIHSRRLVTLCEICEFKYSKYLVAWTPELRCICGGHLKPVVGMGHANENITFEIAVANLAGDLASRNGPPDLSPEKISAEIRNHFGDMSLRSLRRGFRELILDTAGEAAAEIVGVTDEAVDKFIGVDSGAGLVRNPLKSLIVVQAFWGGWGCLTQPTNYDRATSTKQRVTRNAMWGEKSLEGRRRSEYASLFNASSHSERQLLRSKYRSWLMEIVDTKPSVRRKELLKYKGYWPAIRHLLSVDSDWFDEMLPRRSTLVRNHDGRPVTYAISSRHIEGIVRQIYAMQNLAVTTRPTFRIGIRYLTLPFGANFVSSVTFAHPDVQKALNACKDTYDSHRLRITRHIVELVGRLNPNHRWADESVWAAYSNHSFNSARTLALKWLREKDASR